MVQNVPILRQRWERVLFLHWAVDQDRLAPHLPNGIELETHDGAAWISIIALKMKGMRPLFVPRIPFVSDTLSTNVRTYVKRHGTPGVYFFSMDANNLGAVLAGRSMFKMPYHWATMSSRREEDRLRFASKRRTDGEIAELRVEYSRLGNPTTPEPDSLEYFLAERYATINVARGEVKMTRVVHTPWRLERVELHSFASTVLQASQLPGGAHEPLAFAGDDKEVKMFLPESMTERAIASLPSLSPLRMRSPETL